MNCPNHIENNVLKLTDANKFTNAKFDNFHFPYLIKCNCGSEEFELVTNPEPMLIVKCKECGNEIIVYNLRFYPAASLVPFDGTNTKYVSPRGDQVFNVCVIYEYPELEANDKFDQNDITWCVVYGLGVNSKEVFEIINDETA